MLRSIRAVVSDLDGTLVTGNRPLPGLLPFFNLLQQRRVALTVVTNNTVRTPEQYWRKLSGFGAPVEPEQILTAALATAAHLRDRLPPSAPLFVIGEVGLRSALLDAGFTLLDDGRGPVAAVVVGGDRGLDYAKLKHAIRHVREGARFVGANPDLLVPTEEGLAPEAGVTLAAIEAATGVAAVVIGKPERPLLDRALARMGASAATTAILGDRLDTDILGGKRLGLFTILVTTGADNEAAIAAKGIRPDLVVAGLDELTARLASDAGL